MSHINHYYLASLLIDCHSSQGRTSCLTADTYTAVGRILARLDKELFETLKIKVPVMGPDPSPELTKSIQRFLLDGDPDGSPMHPFPTANFSSDQERAKAALEAASQLRDIFKKIVSSLDENIREIEQKIEK